MHVEEGPPSRRPRAPKRLYGQGRNNNKKNYLRRKRRPWHTPVFCPILRAANERRVPRRYNPGKSFGGHASRCDFGRLRTVPGVWVWDQPEFHAIVGNSLEQSLSPPPS